LLERCAKRLGNALDPYLAEIGAGECQVHLVQVGKLETNQHSDDMFPAAIGTRIFDRPMGRHMQAHWCGGNGKAILAVVPQLETYAREQGCSRLLPDYRVEQITIGKAL
jgi:hypothetical protein